MSIARQVGAAKSSPTISARITGHRERRHKARTAAPRESTSSYPRQRRRGPDDGTVGHTPNTYGACLHVARCKQMFALFILRRMVRAAAGTVLQVDGVPTLTGAAGHFPDPRSGAVDLLEAILSKLDATRFVLSGHLRRGARSIPVLGV
jgi:hypothetical protein